MKRRTLLWLSLAAAGSVFAQTPAVTTNQAVNSWATDYGTFSLDSRLRYESVNDDGFAEDANALTWRNRLGFRTKSAHGFSALVEFENVQALIDDYSSAAFAGNTRAIVSDPEGSEWNQALVQYQGAGGFKATLGRQRMAFDNQRFIGGAAWRQNEQTFDALAINWTLPNNGVLDLAWIDEVHRIFGNAHPNPALREWDLSMPVVHYAQPLGNGTIAAYGYWFENKDVPNASSATLGFRYTGKRIDPEWNWKPLWTVEYARQSDYADAASRDTQDYRLLEFGLSRASGHTVKLGWEVLSGDGIAAFQTPLASAHPFAGWADRFVNTPTLGLDDRYFTWTGPCLMLTCTGIWHEFESETAGVDFGRELDFSAAYTINKNWTTLFKVAQFSDADTLADAKKFWLSVEYKH